MKCHIHFGSVYVKLLALWALISLPGCAFIDRQYSESCKSHAHLRLVLADYINSRFHSQAPVRMAIVPYSTPANLSASSTERPGLGNAFAWQLQSEFVGYEDVPIVEVFNRQDWPGKKEEFFTGNFQGIRLAREAGYDLVLIGLIESPSSINKLTAHTKVIEVDSGITVFYGESTASSGSRRLDRQMDGLWLGPRDPSKMYMPAIIDELATCVAQEVMSTRG